MNYPVVMIRVIHGSCIQIKSYQVDWYSDKEESNSNNKFKKLDKKKLRPGPTLGPINQVRVLLNSI